MAPPALRGSEGGGSRPPRCAQESAPNMLGLAGNCSKHLWACREVLQTAPNCFSYGYTSNP
eukprot:14551069-Alexandrium_andersonii.AAC.1